MAVKVIPRKRHDKPINKVNRMIYNEINNLIKLRGCEHVAQLHEIISPSSDPDNVYLVMEYLGGHSLRDLISAVSHEPLPIRQHKAHAIIRDIAAALLECHKHDIVHGDVKPDNIIYSENHEKYKLVDFGSSRELNQHTHSCVLDAATLAYAAPEVLMYHSEPVTLAYDMWSLGKITQDLMNITFNGQMNKTIKTIMDVTLVKDPSQRASAEQVLDILVTSTSH